MGNILGSWSGMRKYLEKDMLANSLKGRIRYGCTNYYDWDAFYTFEVCIDDKRAKCFTFESVCNYFDNIELNDRSKYPFGVWSFLNQCPVTDRTEYTDEEFCQALELYRNQDIQKSIASENPMVRMFAILDRRIGKRTLARVKETLNEQPLWLRQFYRLRIEAENV